MEFITQDAAVGSIRRYYHFLDKKVKQSPPHQINSLRSKQLYTFVKDIQNTVKPTLNLDHHEHQQRPFANDRNLESLLILKVIQFE